MKKLNDMIGNKKGFKTAVLALFFGLSACNDLVEEPEGLLSPEGLFKSVNDIHTAINGGYSAIASEELYGRKLPMTLMLRSDMVDIGDPTTFFWRVDCNNFQMNPSNDLVEDIWPRAYEAIAAVNIAIEGSKVIDGIDQDQINEAIADAFFLRAFMHYHLVRLFGPIPYIDYIFLSPDDAFAIDENTEEEVYEKIIRDLEFAKQWLPDQPINRTRPGKGTAAGYLASVYLTLGEWQNAYDEASFVIGNSTGFNYELVANYQSLFDPSLVDGIDVAKEYLFYIDFVGLDASGLTGFQNYTRDYLAAVSGPRGDERHGDRVGEGWSAVVPSMAVYDSWAGNDYRKAVSFDTVTVMGDTLTPYTSWNQADRGVARPHIAKYFRFLGNASGNGFDSDHNYPAMRYAEVLLIAAEALNELNSGSTAEAVGYINEIRARARLELDANAANDRAFPADLTGSFDEASFLDIILEERRIELAFEFKRWYDIKRRKLADINGDVFGAGGLEVHSNFDPRQHYLFPKPQSELDVLRNLDQNFGYGTSN